MAKNLLYVQHQTGIFCIFCIFCMFCILITYLCILCIFTMRKSCSRHSLFISTIAWSPIPGPSCSCTTTYNHCSCSQIYCRKLQESQQILDAWRRVLFWWRPLPVEQEEGTPVWRTLESHTRLVLVLCVCRSLQIDTDPPRLM